MLNRSLMGSTNLDDLILIAFITGNSSLEPLIEGLCAQIHVNLRWRVVGRNNLCGENNVRYCDQLQNDFLLVAKGLSPKGGKY